VHIIPKTKLSVETKRDGYRYAVVTRHWLRSTVLFEVPISLEFWPSVFKVPITKGVRFPEEPKPSDEEVRTMKDFVGSRGYKILRKFWNWRLLDLTFLCTSRKENSEYARGMFQGFLEARVTAEKIAEFGGEVEGIAAESTEDMYTNMDRMNRDAEMAREF
jgi:hypothetical protein